MAEATEKLIITESKLFFFGRQLVNTNANAHYALLFFLYE